MLSFLKKYRNKFVYAFQGLFHGILNDNSIRIQCCIGVIVLALCTFLSLSCMEWVIILLVIGLIVTFEFINSAVEHIVDYISPTYSEQAKIIKDYTAAAVLVMSIVAAAVGILIIGGKLL